jgi:hypothetical protein
MLVIFMKNLMTFVFVQFPMRRPRQEPGPSQPRIWAPELRTTNTYFPHAYIPTAQEYQQRLDDYRDYGRPGVHRPMPLLQAELARRQRVIDNNERNEQNLERLRQVPVHQRDDVWHKVCYEPYSEVYSRF